MTAPLGPIVSEVRTIEQLIAPDFERLYGLSRNLWWCWDTTGETLFRALNPTRWRELSHNPVALIAEIPLVELDERIDNLPQAKYWDQVRNGMWMRASLIASIFNCDTAIRDHYYAYYTY